MLPTRDQFLANTARWRQMMGDSASKFITPDGDVARRAVAGEIGFRHIGVKFTPVGRRDIDWSGLHHPHQEWPAQLNRFFQLGALAAEYRRTGDEQYAQAAADYIHDWLRVHPTRAGWQVAPYDNTLNLSIRVICWLSSLPELAASPLFDDAMLAAMFDSVSAQLEFLSGNLTVFGNWRIAQADSLLLAGVVMDGAPAAAAWRQQAVDVLNDAFHRQVLPDGAHVERTPGYHDWMCRVFEGYWRLGRAMPKLGLAMQAAAIARMHDYSLATRRPTGGLNAMHDCGGALTGERPADWADARGAFLREAGLDDALPPTSQFFPDAGQALLRDSWDPTATYLTFDATPWGGGHCHLSRNAVQLHAFGRTLLVDPGTLTYEASDPMMAHGKSTRAHNTVNLNGWNQCTNDPKTRFFAGEGYDLVASLYDGGYWPGRYEWHWPQGFGPGIWAEHHRAMLWVKGRFVVVLDDVYNNALADNKPALEINWQFGPGELQVDLAARRAVTTHDDANVLLMTALAPPEMAAAVHAGEMDPPAGWLSGEGGYQPAPQLRLRSPRHETWQTDIATVLVPFAGKACPQVTAEGRATGSGTPGRVTLRWADGSTDTILWTRRLESAIGTAEGITTDASLVHIHRSAAGKLLAAMALDATHLRPLSRKKLREPGMIVVKKK